MKTEYLCYLAALAVLLFADKKKTGCQCGGH